jgi:N-acetylglucosamine-6-sulfatase
MKTSKILLAGLSLSCGTIRAAEAQKPNIVFILVDDLRRDALGCMDHPFLKTPNIDRIAKEGALFKNAFTTISICSPSRAGFLTGTYPQVNGVKRNEKTDPDPSVPNMGQLFQQAGYDTAFIGKWHMKPGAEPRPGFDHWLSFDGQGIYNDPLLNENGRDFQQKGYMTDILTDHAVNWMKKDRPKPFFLCLSHKAVHMTFTPAQRHTGLYSDADMPEPPYWQDTLAGKPEWQRAAWVRGNSRKDWIANNNRPVPGMLPPEPWKPHPTGMRLKYYQTLSAVDDSVATVFQTLEKTGELDNTVIVFASDNGFVVPDEKRIRSDKRVANDQSIRIPFLMRYPSSVRPGSTIEKMVLNIDLLPTLLDFAGASIPEQIQGRSFKPLLTGQPVEWRQSFLYQYFMEDWVPGIPGVQCVRTEKWKYMRYPDIKEQTELYKTLDDMDELYDLQNDPHELHNLARNPEYKNQLEKMRVELERLLKETESSYEN